MVVRDIRLIVLDFDGVIAESNGAKDEAFHELFGEYPEHEASMLAFHEENFSSPRMVKFRHYAQNLMEGGDEDAVARMATRFSELVVDRVVATELVPGARDFLDRWSQRVPLYVASVTPQDELRVIVQRKGLSRYFAGVFGNPPLEKSDAIRRAFEAEKVDPVHTLLVGDAPSDSAAAQTAGVGFVGRVSEKGFGELEVVAAPDLFGVAEILEQWMDSADV